MQISDIIAITLGSTGFIISIVTFILSPALSLRAKRLEKRLEYRFQLFQKVFELWEFTHSQTASKKPNIEGLLKELNKLIQLYGYPPEVNSFDEVVKSYNHYAMFHSEENRAEMIKKFNRFLSIAFATYRKELILD